MKETVETKKTHPVERNEGAHIKSPRAHLRGFKRKKGRGIFLISFCLCIVYIRKGASVSVMVLLLLKYWGNPKAAVDISHL